jgi:hypothetical protein
VEQATINSYCAISCANRSPYLGHSISAAHFSIQLVQIEGDVVGVIRHGHPQARSAVLVHKVLESVEELLALRLVAELVLLGIGKVAARAGTVLDLVFGELRRRA